jgi:hypothetical protein
MKKSMSGGAATEALIRSTGNWSALEGPGGGVIEGIATLDSCEARFLFLGNPSHLCLLKSFRRLPDMITQQR